MVAERRAQHRPPRWRRERCLAVWEDASKEQLGIREGPDGEQRAANPRRLLSVAALDAAGEVQFEAAPPEGAEPEGLEHVHGLDAAARHGLGSAR
jgi:hypothetical protein